MSNEKQINTLLKFATYVFIGSIILWITETLVFLWVQGWHLKATNPIEIFFDKCVLRMWNVCSFIFTFCFLDFMYNFLKPKLK